MPKVRVAWRSVCFIRQPEGVHGTEEDPVEYVASIGLEANVPPLAEVGVFVNREVFVVVPKPADMFVIARGITKGKRPGISPSRLVEIRAACFRVGIAKVPCQSGPDFIGKLVIIKEISVKYTVISGDRQWPPRLIRLRCRDLP